MKVGESGEIDEVVPNLIWDLSNSKDTGSSPV